MEEESTSEVLIISGRRTGWDLVCPIVNYGALDLVFLS